MPRVAAQNAARHEDAMPDQHEILSVPANLPDHAVLTKAQTCALTNLSEDTLARLHRNGDGPERVQLSPRRVGYTVAAVRGWLQKRSST
jgi:predicted DNA-binding transcriptional regulator AlpA